MSDLDQKYAKQVMQHVIDLAKAKRDEYEHPKDGQLYRVPTLDIFIEDLEEYLAKL